MRDLSKAIDLLERNAAQLSSYIKENETISNRMNDYKDTKEQYDKAADYLKIYK